MAAREHHPKLAVFDRLRFELLLDSRRERPFTLEQPPQLWCELTRGAFAAQHVERAVLRRGHEPRGRVFRHTPEFPHFQRAAEGVLHNVFCQREVMHSKNARQRGNDAPRFAPKQMLIELHHMLSFMTGRTSTAPSTSRIGQPFESSTAWFRSRASIRVYPPTTSLASANGPSVTVFCLPFTSLPARSSGWPWSLTCPLPAISLNQAIHFCITCCACSGDLPRSPPR